MENALSDATGRAEARYRNWRMLKDRVFGWTMAVGGIGVIIAIVVILFYLFYAVIPMFAGARIEQVAKYQLPYSGTEIVHLTLDEYAEIGFAITADGQYAFFDTANGTSIEQGQVFADNGRKVLASASGDPDDGAVFLAVDDSHAIVVRPHYAISYPNDKRHITPTLEYPLGRTPIDLGISGGGSITLIAGNSGPEETTIAAATTDGALVMTHVVVEESLLGDEQTLETSHVALPGIDFSPAFLLVDVDQRELYAASSDGRISYFNIQKKNDPRLLDLVNVTVDGGSLTSLEFLSGGISILAGDSTGQVQQWFPLRDNNNNYSLELVRSFRAFDSAVSALAPEYYRKGFLAADSNGNVGLFHTTAGQVLLVDKIADENYTRYR